MVVGRRAWRGLQWAGDEPWSGGRGWQAGMEGGETLEPRGRGGGERPGEPGLLDGSQLCADTGEGSV